MKVIAIVLVLFATRVWSQQFGITEGAINPGGGASSGGNFNVIGALTPAQTSQGGSYTAVGGFKSIVAVIQMPGAPELKIGRLLDKVILSWAASTNQFVLETTHDLEPLAQWKLVPEIPVSVVSERRVMVPAPAGHQFFRLRRQ